MIIYFDVTSFMRTGTNKKTRDVSTLCENIISIRKEEDGGRIATLDAFRRIFEKRGNIVGLPARPNILLEK